MDSLHEALRQNYGWNSFKPGQLEILQAILSGKDAIAVLPTGGGKSICFQLPALINKGLVVVISPLVALMEDQVAHMREKGIPAACLHAGSDNEDIKKTIFACGRNDLRLLYLAPERLESNFVLNLLRQKSSAGQIVALAVDEAHCISFWGHDFRPAYRKLGSLRNLFPGIPLIALSATAAPQVRADIIYLLKMKSPYLHICSSRRDNLFYSMIARTKDPLLMILKELCKARGASLIYLRTRRSVEKWTKTLQENGIPAISYHAGLSSIERKIALTHFLHEERPVLIATVAFGMGIDRSDVGLVLHLDLPLSPEGYLQQSGRAGRDGMPAKCMVLFSSSDRKKLNWLIKSSKSSNKQEPNENEKLRRSQFYSQLRKMEAIAEGSQCLEQALLLAVGELVPPCGRCDRCNSNLPLQDWSDNALKMLTYLEKKKSIDFQDLINGFPEKNYAKDIWEWLARKLVQEEFIYESNDGYQKLSIREQGLIFLKQPWPLIYAS